MIKDYFKIYDEVPLGDNFHPKYIFTLFIMGLAIGIMITIMLLITLGSIYLVINL